MYSLRLLGGVLLQGPCGPLSGRVVQRRQLALLALLACARDKGLTRDKLIGYLWPETEGERARRHLSDALYVLRRALGEEAVLSAGEVLRLNAESARCDVCAFEDALETGDVEVGVGLYEGPFLDGFYLGDGREFEGWVEAERARLADRYASALESLAMQAEEVEEHQGAAEWWKRLAVHDPYNSRAMVRLVKALAAAGDPANALELARGHEIRLREELGIEPPDELWTFAEQLRAEAAAGPGGGGEGWHTVSRSAASVGDAPGHETPTPSGWRDWIREIHRRSLWQVLLIFLAASWVVLEVADVVIAGLALPPRIYDLAIILLLVGLAVVLATALVQEGLAPSRREAEAPARGEENAFEAPSAAARDKSMRRLLTWRNAIGGCFLGIGFWCFLGAGFLLLRDSRNRAGSDASAVDRKSVAVLPFANMSADPANEYFSDGITDDIITHLATIADLRVISRQSIMQYKGSDKSLPQIAEELGVATVLEGGVQRIGDRVRINAQLIDANSDENVWVEQYDRQLSDVFLIQSDVARKIAAALQATLTEVEKQQIAVVPTRNPHAYEYYLLGNVYRWGETASDKMTAVDMYHRAIELDPEFAHAYAKLSEAHLLLYWRGYDPSDRRLAEAETALDRAVKLNPDLPEVHRALGFYYYHGQRDYERALDEFEMALEGRPSDGDVLLGIGFVKRRQGRMQEAIEFFRRGSELNIEIGYYSMAQTYFLLRDYEQAQHYFDRVVSISRFFAEVSYRDWAWTLTRIDGTTERAREVLRAARDDGYPLPFEWVRLDYYDRNYRVALARLDSLRDAGQQGINAEWRARLHGLLGNRAAELAYWDSARAILEQRLAELPKIAVLHSRLGIAFAGLGRSDDATREARLGLELLPVSVDVWWGSDRVLQLARVYTMLGEHAAAIEHLEHLLSIPYTLSVSLLKLDPLWDPLRDHPRFQALLARNE